MTEPQFKAWWATRYVEPFITTEILNESIIYATFGNKYWRVGWQDMGALIEQLWAIRAGLA